MIHLFGGSSRVIGDRLEMDVPLFQYTVARQGPTQPGLPQSARVDEVGSFETALKLHVGVADENVRLMESVLEGHECLGRGIGPKTTLFSINGITMYKTQGQTLPFNHAGR